HAFPTKAGLVVHAHAMPRRVNQKAVIMPRIVEHRLVIYKDGRIALELVAPEKAVSESLREGSSLCFFGECLLVGVKVSLAILRVFMTEMSAEFVREHLDERASNERRLQANQRLVVLDEHSVYVALGLECVLVSVRLLDEDDRRSELLVLEQVQDDVAQRV